MTLLQAIESVPKETIDPIRRYESIRDYLNERPQIENPTPQGQIPDPPKVNELFKLLTPEDMPILEQATKLLQTGQVISETVGLSMGSTVDTLFDFMKDLGLSEQATTAIEARLQQTKADLNWQPTIPGQPRYTEFGLTTPVTLEQIQEALN